MILRGRWKAGPKLVTTLNGQDLKLIGLWNFLDVSLILFASLTIRTNPVSTTNPASTTKTPPSTTKETDSTTISSATQKNTFNLPYSHFQPKTKWLSTGGLYSAIELLGIIQNGAFKRLALGEKKQRTQMQRFSQRNKADPNWALSEGLSAVC